MSATNRGAKRNERDFYPTPLESFTPLIPYLSDLYEVWEPACGDGRLIKKLQNNGFTADGNDLKNGYNFLEDNNIYDCILTNPPFSLAQDFISHAINKAKYEVWMLLRLNLLGSQKRKGWWEDHKPNSLFILSKRPSFTGKGTDACEYAWFYWSKYRGRYSKIYWL